VARAKPKPESLFTGRWRIVSMSAWDEDFIDEEEEGFVTVHPIFRNRCGLAQSL
jgi:hypothetical protein